MASSGTELVQPGSRDPFIDSIAPDAVLCVGSEFSFSAELTESMFLSDAPETRTNAVPTVRLTKSIYEVFESLRGNHGAPLTVGVVPIENIPTVALEENVRHLFSGDFVVLGEATLMIRLMFASKAQSIGEVERVYSHSAPVGQASQFLQRHRLTIEEVASTSLAASLAARKDKSAALCSLRAAQHNGLNIIEHDVQDSPDNQTRFYIIKARNGGLEPDLGKLRRDQPGGLSKEDEAKVVGIVSPTRPERSDGYSAATAHLGRVGVHAYSLGRLSAQTDKSIGGDRTYFVEFTGSPGKLHEIFHNPASFEDVMKFQLLGVFAVGSRFSA